MCGIFAYLNFLTPKKRSEIIDILIQGLQQMEYTGYGSAELAIDGGSNKDSLHSKTFLLGREGKVSVLADSVQKLEGLDMDMTYEIHCGIAHARLDTYNCHQDANTRPQRSDDPESTMVKTKGLSGEGSKGELAGVVTGERLVPSTVFSTRIFCARGFTSTTALNLPDEIFRIINSSTAVNANDDPTKVSGVNLSDWELEYFFASDFAAFVGLTMEFTSLGDDVVASVEDGALSIRRIRRGHGEDTIPKKDVQNLTMELQEIMKGSFKTFMRKEIFEQPDSVVNTMRGRVLSSDQVILGGIKDQIMRIKGSHRLIMVACGTSYNSAIACRQILEELSELPVVLELASDFLDRKIRICRDDVCIFISQSGETADTLEALRYCESRDALLIGITNTVDSSIYRESHCGVHINAGPEFGVASTKAYTSQILALLMFALCLSDDRLSAQQRRSEIINALNKLPEQIKEVPLLDLQILEVTKDLRKKESLLIMGRGFNFATCLEGALKITEISNMHCKGIMSGELKHDHLAMVGKNRQVCIIMASDSVYNKSLNALKEIIARGGTPIIIADKSVPKKDLSEGSHILCVPKTVDCVQNILSVIPLQLLSYHIAELNGFNINHPRNLAESVKVE